MLSWIDVATVAGIAYITNAVTGTLKRRFRLKGRGVQFLALFIAITISLFNEFIIKNPELLAGPPGLPLFKAIGIGVITGFLAVAHKDSQKPRTEKEVTNGNP